MRLLLLSDIHADIEALDRVLADASRRGFDQAVFLGDAVGYGDAAEETLQRLRSLPLRAALRGNHEAMLSELLAGERPEASREVVQALQRNRAELSRESLEFLGSLQELHLDAGWGAVHGALRRPYEYLISVPAARGNGERMERPLYFVGHTHVPAAFVAEQGGTWRARAFRAAEGSLRLPDGARAFLNPGAVSLPRDSIPGSSYGIFDEERRSFSVYRLQQ